MVEKTSSWGTRRYVIRLRQRSEALQQPCLEVGRQADCGGHRSEDHGLHEDAWHQEVDVGNATRDLDRAAENVAEHQHEDHRLDGGEDEQLGYPPVRDQVAPEIGSAPATLS